MFFITKYRNKAGKIVDLREAAATAPEEDNAATSQSTETPDAGADSGDTANQQDATQDTATENNETDSTTEDQGGSDTDISMDVDMGDEGGGDAGGEGGDDSSADSTGSSGDSTNEDEEVDENKKTEEEIFGDLTHDQLDIKHKELKNQYLNLYDMTTEIIDRISSIAISEEITFVIDYVSTTLSNLRDMVVDYINDVYKTKSYTENLINYNRFLATLSGINKILEEINKTGEKE